MIPPFDEKGNLPLGIHWAEWAEFKTRFGRNISRQRMIKGLELAMIELKKAGCQTIYLNGSFVTDKPFPNDFDACWEREGVNIDYLRKNAPNILNFFDSRSQKAKYKGEIYPSDQPIDEAIITLDFFQQDRNGNPKGIIAIDLTRWEND